LSENKYVYYPFYPYTNNYLRHDTILEIIEDLVNEGKYTREEIKIRDTIIEEGGKYSFLLVKMKRDED